jgi:phenylalanyl-tRNA synthetase beta chain
MKVSLKWLRDYVDVALPADELARRLTMAGIEVDGIHQTGAAFGHVWTARLQKIERHPNADRLQLVTADYGGRTIRVVTGATNIKEGDVVPLGLVGTRYRDGHSNPPVERELQPTTMRGIQSEGMVMSGFELGLSDDHAGILVLPPDTQVGIPFAEALASPALRDSVVAPDRADVLASLAQADTVIELDLKGRADCLAMLGVAREVAALTGSGSGSDAETDEGRTPSPEVRIPRAAPTPARQRRDDEPVKIGIEDPALCARFVGILLKKVRIGPSPAWMQERLQAAGMRPINNVVDITNFVMLEWGQPLHAYDYDTVRGGELVARPARAGEKLLTLAEERPEIELTPEHLVIADAERPVGLAGVIGGADTEVRDTTTSILLEAANFKPISIRRTARAMLPRPTEASRRFERGIPPEHTLPAALRAAQLMVELAGAELVGEPVDTYPSPVERMPITLPATEFRRLLGVDYDAATIEGVFDRLRFVYEKPDPATSAGAYVVTLPVWRLDIERPADLVEEVARIDGYHRIPATLMRGEPAPPAANAPLEWEDAARQVFVGAGFSEAITYAWTSEEKLGRVPRSRPNDPDDRIQKGGSAGTLLAALVDARVAPLGDPVRIANPSSQDQDVMRTSALPSLLQTLADNLRHTNRDTHFFELGRIYVRRPARDGQAGAAAAPADADMDLGLPEERRVLTAALGQWRTGPRYERADGTVRGHPGTALIENDFYYVKSVVEELLERMAIGGHGYVAVQHPAFHPYRAAALVLNHRPEAAGKKPILAEEVVGILGEVDSETAARFDIDQRCYLVALDFDRLIGRASNERRHGALPQRPPVLEDLAFVVKADLPAERLVASITRAGAPLVESVELFDVYQGDRIPEGTRSLAFSVTYRAPDHTLSAEEVAAVRAKIVQQAERQTGAKLRGDA